MKKRALSIISLILCAVMLFGACDNENNEESTSGSDIITEAPLADTEQTTAATGNEERTTEAESTTKEGTTLIGEIVGYTSKGYAITQKDGITYVDGILIANKTYALPASYNPGGLLSECSEAFNRMQSDAAAAGLTIWNASGFRSYDLQQSLYTRYSNRDGKAAADRYSARPGHSEHQTGLAIDLNEITSSFANTAEGKWIAQNCWRYGFILRYMEGKEAQTGYMYEPWHIRYVGVEAAEKIYASGLCLEEYYGITSVYADTAENSEEATTEAAATEAVSVPDETSTEAVTTQTAAPEETTVEEIVD